MGRIWWFILALVLAACAEEARDVRTGPILVRQVTMDATNALPVLATTPTPARLTPEVISPLVQITVDADFVLVTPTLPPSKTPTTTPTFTMTPTPTPTPTMTVSATATTFLLPTSQISAVTRAVAAPVNRVCDSSWFFIEPRPASCPLYPPAVSQGVYQSFQNGHMVWVGNQDAIYVLYSDNRQPRWQVYRDYFNEGMVEELSQYSSAPGPSLWQPRRGFGLLWRNDGAVRNRIGWGTIEWEEPYSAQVQSADDGTIFISMPRNQIFALLPNGSNWRLLNGTSGIPGITSGGGGAPPPAGATQIHSRIAPPLPVIPVN